MPKPIQTLSSKIAFNCPWYNVRQDEIRLPNGSNGIYNVVQVPSCVFIVPVTASGEIVLIHQYRHTLQDWVWEVPAGGMHAGQTPLQAAEQELREEVGGVSDDWHSIGSYCLANGISDSTAHMFVALNVELGDVAHESAEIITVHPTPIAQVQIMVQNHQITDAPSALAILLAQPHFT